MRIEFYFTDNKVIETVNCSEKDVRRLISQFNNGHLMQAGAAHINPKKCFISLFMKARSQIETIHSYLDIIICWTQHLADGQDSRFGREEADGYL